MRVYPSPEDLGLDPEADQTEDLRPGNGEAPRTAIPGASVPTLTKHQIGDPIMSRNPYPVDNDWRVSDKRRRIANILMAYPASDWTLDEAHQVHKLLSKFVRERQADAARTAQW